MKTIIPTTGASNKAGQDVNSAHGSAPQAEAYWTLWRRDDDSRLRKAWDIPLRDTPALPHEGLCHCGFDSPAKLLDDLLSKGWKEDSFDGTLNRFVLIEATANGITVTAFETYRSACDAHALSAS